MARVVSSNINDCEYDAERQYLTVRFKRGGVYGWPGVPEDLYQGLLKAESPTRYLNEYIKPVYTAERLA